MSIKELLKSILVDGRVGFDLSFWSSFDCGIRFLLHELSPFDYSPRHPQSVYRVYGFSR